MWQEFCFFEESLQSEVVRSRRTASMVTTGDLGETKLKNRERDTGLRARARLLGLVL